MVFKPSEQLRAYFKVPIWFWIFNNFIPLYGLFKAEWRAEDILLFFGVELVVVGLINIVQIILVKGKVQLPFKYNGASEHRLESHFQVKVYSIILFILWYGIYACTFFLVINKYFTDFTFESIKEYSLLLLIFNVILLVVNYFMKKDHFNITPVKMATKPIPRIAGIVTLILFIPTLGSGLLFAIVLLFVKTYFDYWSYAHNKSQTLINE